MNLKGEGAMKMILTVLLILLLFFFAYMAITNKLGVLFSGLE